MSRAEQKQITRIPHPALLLITDRQQAASPLESVVIQALDSGCRWLLMREKDQALGERRSLAAALREITRARGAWLSLSNDITLAREVAADGVHLSREGDPRAAREWLGPAALIGRSAHDLEEARGAFLAGADYVTLSPIFPSASKPGYGPALGLEALKAAASALPGPVIALGGVTATNAAACLVHGAKGVAVMGEVMRAAKPESEVAALLGAITTESRA